MVDRISEESKDKIFYLSKDEFEDPIENNYARTIGEMNPEDLYDDYNPGPTLPDGGVNFECHCVSHLVASPCGYEFREAISCQKAASEEELENGKCAEEFINFMECVIRTDCFRPRGDGKEEGESTKAPGLEDAMSVGQDPLSRSSAKEQSR